MSNGMGDDVGDVVQLRFHDVAEEKHLIGKELTVTKVLCINSPYWLEVSFEGKAYSVRGSDTILVRRTP
jgi:hypothetical protein